MSIVQNDFKSPPAYEPPPPSYEDVMDEVAPAVEAGSMPVIEKVMLAIGGFFLLLPVTAAFALTVAALFLFVMGNTGTAIVCLVFAALCAFLTAIQTLLASDDT